MSSDGHGRSALTGRISAVPSELWHSEVLAPQFARDVSNLLPGYLAIEKVLLVEYERMGLLTTGDARSIAALLHRLEPGDLTADAGTNLSDLSFAIEQHVRGGLGRDVVRWHVDRSRNDLQATAQLLYGRRRLLDVATVLLEFVTQTSALATAHRSDPMPGHTHFQVAQVITPGFYLSAVCSEALKSLRRLLQTYDQIDLSPLGAGAMAGQELAWDRSRMAELLGFRGVEDHALTSVASRTWTAAVAADLCLLGVVLSRFATDLMTWGGSEFRFIDLPDELAGISSAMPQKRNFPVLERIRGRTAHLASLYLDVVLGQRNTPYTNLVEVGKEAGAGLASLFDTVESVLRLFTAVMANLRFRTARMRSACEGEYLGGFTLANQLTLGCGVPWRTAQVVAGEYVRAVTDKGVAPDSPDAELLVALAAQRGHRVDGAAELLSSAFGLEHALTHKRSAGSTSPDAVRDLLRLQGRELDAVAEALRQRRVVSEVACREVDRLLGLTLAGSARGEDR
jgi:argininosuccinate lyase